MKSGVIGERALQYVSGFIMYPIAGAIPESPLRSQNPFFRLSRKRLIPAFPIYPTGWKHKLCR
jgi:hypothetical protein